MSTEKTFKYSEYAPVSGITLGNDSKDNPIELIFLPGKEVTIPGDYLELPNVLYLIQENYLVEITPDATPETPPPEAPSIAATNTPKSVDSKPSNKV